MKVGTKSLLFGTHQFIWHPITVYLAWCRQYGRRPSWREAVCILVHDWGYWGKPNINGREGERHPELGARIAGWLLGEKYGRLVLYHSRHYARLHSAEPSKLCWADKRSILHDPPWFYLLRARLSGEWSEYRADVVRLGAMSSAASDWECLQRLRYWFSRLAETEDPAAVVYNSAGPSSRLHYRVAEAVQKSGRARGPKRGR